MANALEEGDPTRLATPLTCCCDLDRYISSRFHVSIIQCFLAPSTPSGAVGFVKGVEVAWPTVKITSEEPRGHQQIQYSSQSPARQKDTIYPV